jgi:hypothetical protein
MIFLVVNKCHYNHYGEVKMQQLHFSASILAAISSITKQAHPPCISPNISLMQGSSNHHEAHRDGSVLHGYGLEVGDPS